MWKAKKPFKNYVKGDTVKEEDAKCFGSLYCAKSDNADSNAIDTVNASEEANTEIITETANTAGNTIADAGDEAKTEEVTKPKDKKKK